MTLKEIRDQLETAETEIDELKELAERLTEAHTELEECVREFTGKTVHRPW